MTNKKKSKSSENNSLYDNPMVESARQNMTKEQLEAYKSQGESMYNSIDFVDNNGKSRNAPEELLDAVSYIINSINSGMHISYLEENEKFLLEDVLGKEWYTNFGYVQEDLYEIVTTPDSSMFSFYSK
jgi:hypothetical protein